jgi:hypothetical protein
LRHAISRQLREFDSFVQLRRLQHEGFGNAYRRWRLWCRVLDLPPVRTEPSHAHAQVEVHLVCCQRDYLCALWALKSFYLTAGVTYPLVVHTNGPMSALALSRLRSHLPQARVIEQGPADRQVVEWLDGHRCDRLRAIRARNGFMLKLVDVNLLSEARHLLLLDSDVLFFRRPGDLLGAVDAPTDGFLFQRDAGTTYNITPADAVADLGIPLQPAVNTGIVLFDKRALDLRRCESLLAHPKVAQQSGWIEQTLYALVASEQAGVRYLPSTYLVSLAPRADLASLVARHYAGPSRQYLTEEGLPFALQRLDTPRPGALAPMPSGRVQ